MVITSPTRTTIKPPSSSNLGSGRTASQAKNLSSGKGFSASNLQPKTASQAKNNIAPFKRPAPSTTPSGKGSSSLSSSAKSSAGVSGVSKALGATRLGVNAKGDISLGLGFGSVGIGASAKGDISLGLGIVSVTIDPRDANNSAIGFGFNTMTITGTKEGCTTTLFYKILGQVVNTETRVDPDCKKSEPIEEPDPKTSNDIKKNNKDSLDSIPPPPTTGETTPDPVPIPLTPGANYAIVYSASGHYDYYKAKAGDIYWFVPDTVSLGDNRDIGNKIVPIFYRLDPDIKIKFYEAVGLGWTLAPWTIPGIGTEAIVPQGQNNAGTSYFYGIGASWWLGDVGGSSFEPNHFTAKAGATPTKAEYVWNGEGYSVKIENFPVGPEGRTKWFNGIPNARIVEIPPSINLKNPITKTPRTPIMDDCCEEIKEIISDIYDMLGGDTFYNNGLTIPTQMFTPGGSGLFKMKNYHEIANVIFRTFSHRTPGEIEFTIDDTNKGKEGNQSVNIKTINAQGYYTMLLKSVANLGYENTDQMNVLVRLGVVSSQIMKLLVIINQNAKNLLSFFDVPTKDYIENVDIPFDLSLGGSLQKGFKAREDLQKELLKIVDKDTEEAIEGILDKFLNEWQMPTKVQKLRSTKEGGNFWYFLRQLRS